MDKDHGGSRTPVVDQCGRSRPSNRLSLMHGLGGHKIMKRVSILRAFAGLLLAGAPLLAHHAGATKYDEKKPITLKGVVTKLQWMNPHIYYYIDVKDSSG